jgi:hypothetical protein
LKPIATGPLLKTVKFDADYLPKLPIYKLLLNLKFEASESLAIGLTELQTFQKLFTPAIIDIIIDITNSYTKNTRVNTSSLFRPRF